MAVDAVKDEQTVPLTHDSDDTDSEYGLHSSDTQGFLRQPSKRRSFCQAYLCTIVGYLVCAAVFTFIGAQIARANLDLDGRCAAYTTQYSPVVKDVGIKYTVTPFNGTFMKETIYRQKGSPEVDAAWEALGVDYRVGIMPESEGEASGLTPKNVQRNPKYGGGYLVNVEGMHHLHCLNLLRKSLYFNYQHYKDLGEHAFKNDDHILALHVTHCLDILRQTLMCNVDTGVLGQVWSLPDHGEEHAAHDSIGSDGSDAVHHHDDEDEEDEEEGEMEDGEHEHEIEEHRDSQNHSEDSKKSRRHRRGERPPPPKPQAFPDFNTNHKCKNFDAVRRWAEAHQVPPQDDVPPDYLRPPRSEDIIHHIP